MVIKREKNARDGASTQANVPILPQQILILPSLNSTSIMLYESMIVDVMILRERCKAAQVAHSNC